MTGTIDCYWIQKGPSREEFFDALRLCGEGREVSFTVSIPGQTDNIFLQVRVSGISIHSVRNDLWVLCLQDTLSIIGHRLEAEYEPTKRQGHMRVIG